MVRCLSPAARGFQGINGDIDLDVVMKFSSQRVSLDNGLRRHPCPSLGLYEYVTFQGKRDLELGKQPRRPRWARRNHECSREEAEESEEGQEM